MTRVEFSQENNYKWTGQGRLWVEGREMGDDILGKTHFVAPCVSMERTVVHLLSGEEPGLKVAQEVRGTGS